MRLYEDRGSHAKIMTAMQELDKPINQPTQSKKEVSEGDDHQATRTQARKTTKITPSKVRQTPTRNRKAKANKDGVAKPQKMKRMTREMASSKEFDEHHHTRKGRIKI